MTRALILGGSAEARVLAELLDDEFDIVSSLAGRLAHPSLPTGEVRVGGFGGVDGLRVWLRDNRIDAVVVATHPFAARMTGNAVSAAAALEMPILVVRRPAWVPQSGDRWIAVPTIPAAAAQLPGLGERVFLTIGRQGVGEFADIDTVWFLVRAIDPPAVLPPRHELLLDRGPFAFAAERALLASRRIDVLVTKNSGGDQTAEKLAAARAAGIPVLMIDRPPLPEGVATVDSVGQVAEWLRHAR